MKNTNSAPLALAAGVLALASHTAFADETPEHSFTGKVGLYSEYEYRGISQTSEKPALQLNLDYAHRSGFYSEFRVGSGGFVPSLKMGADWSIALT